MNITLGRSPLLILCFNRSPFWPKSPHTLRHRPPSHLSFFSFYFYFYFLFSFPFSPIFFLNFSHTLSLSLPKHSRPPIFFPFFILFLFSFLFYFSFFPHFLPQFFLYSLFSLTHTRHTPFFFPNFSPTVSTTPLTTTNPFFPLFSPDFFIFSV